MKENIIIGEGTRYPMKGMITLPADATGPVPAVVLVHGSGSSNMDEKVGKLTPFKDIAEGLAHHGIASIRYDKRSYAHPLRMLTDKKHPVTAKIETIDDAILAAEMLKNDPRIDSEAVFIIGHSMGGILAPRIDLEGGDFRGIIIMAGTPRRLEDIMADQLDEVFSQLSPLMRKLSEKKVKKILDKFQGMYELSDEEAKKIKIGNGTTLYYFKEMGQPPVSYYLEKTDKPMLIMQGEKDFQAKADKDFAIYKELLAGRNNVTFRLYENLNHAFVDSVYGLISKAKQEYNVEQHIGENVIADIANWIKTVIE
ncbi:MAG: alpha/beta fold hydrolase [Oscillospiraceae bacterium]|nr:alpha/beta fold hydrolase [Oscillospiraceae bacterium]